MRPLTLVGLIGLVLSLLVLCGSASLPLLTRNASPQEAMLGVIPAGFFAAVSLALLVVGLALGPRPRDGRRRSGVSVLGVLAWVGIGSLVLLGTVTAGFSSYVVYDNYDHCTAAFRVHEERRRELAQLEGRDDPASRQQAELLRNKLGNGRGNRSGCETRLSLFTGTTIAGVFLLAIAALLAGFRIFRRRAEPDEPDPYDEPRRPRRRPREDDY